jgi:hypothetical protein
MIRRRATPTRLAFLLAAAATGAPLAAHAQAMASMRIEDNFRREPNGVILGRLAQGAPLRVVSRQGNWTQVDVEGWVWLASLRTASGDFELVVSASGGENLRSAPSGTVVGRLAQGTLLDELGRQPGWARVSRRGWVWSASVRADEGSSASGSASAAGTPTTGGRGAPAPRRSESFARIGAGGAAILASPDGDTLAHAAPERELQVLARDGNWARVRLEGWVWMPPGASDPAAAPAALVALRPEDLVREPSAHVGRVVTWDLQFISLERAEAIRTDFRQGEPFLLARYGGSDGPFVYVAVPPERLAETQGLVPLERISVTARVRTGAAMLTRTPIVDLLSLERAR